MYRITHDSIHSPVRICLDTEVKGKANYGTQWLVGGRGGARLPSRFFFKLQMD